MMLARRSVIACALLGALWVFVSPVLFLALYRYLRVTNRLVPTALCAKLC